MKIPVCEPEITEEDIQKVSECVRSTWISGISPYVEEFEEKFAQFCGCKYGIATNSGTTALHLALATLGIGRNDQVIMPTLTMIATPNSASYLGASPVLEDAEYSTWNMRTDQLKERLTRITKAIIPVHTYGHPVDFDPLYEFAEKHNLKIIEDAAEAHGALYKNRKIGSLGDLACFSFYANKALTTGEGGMIVTNNEWISEKAKWLRAHAYGKEGKHFYHREIGYGYRMSGMQAALGLSQLNRVDKLILKRRRNARLYARNLKELEGKITLHPEASWAKNIYWMYSILVEDDCGVSRNELMRKLEMDGIETRTFFYPIHVQPIYSHLAWGRKFPIAEALSQKGVNLPSGTPLTKEQIEYVCECIRKHIGG